MDKLAGFVEQNRKLVEMCRPVIKKVGMILSTEEKTNVGSEEEGTH